MVEKRYLELKIIKCSTKVSFDRREQRIYHLVVVLNQWILASTVDD
jgi:hypothetical protein